MKSVWREENETMASKMLISENQRADNISQMAKKAKSMTNNSS